MTITKISIYRFSIPMRPFSIATGTMHFAQNIFIRVYTGGTHYGVGECSAFPMITGETQGTCFALARDFAEIWKGGEASQIEERMDELDSFIAFNNTIKSAFEMALFDLAAKEAGKPLYDFLGGCKKEMETDLTIGIDSPENMACTAKKFKEDGVQNIKIKLGKKVNDDIERVKQIRHAIGPEIRLRIDANQGWSFEDAVFALPEMGKYDIEFCEQPLHRREDDKLPGLREISPIKIMADESVFDHFDANRLIHSNACDYVNIKFAKSGGIREAKKINTICEQNQIPCMMGGMLESRLALTAFAHFASANENIKFYDLDTCLLGHLADPVIGGVRYSGYTLQLPSVPGIGADAEENFLSGCESISI
jgi:L-alanine-DL-glutamate epimerase-like enolase superfamily enzyme